MTMMMMTMMMITANHHHHCCCCCCRTGTLTTARITIIAESLWIHDGFTRDQLALFGALASNRDKKEDPIDRSVISFFDKHSPPELVAAVGLYSKTRSVGFNPIYKRVLWEYSHPELGTVTVAKGLPIKVIDTADGGLDDAADQWKVDGFERLIATVTKVDRYLGLYIFEIVKRNNSKLF